MLDLLPTGPPLLIRAVRLPHDDTSLYNVACNDGKVERVTAETEILNGTWKEVNGKGGLLIPS